ncbi:MAG: PIG-L deacetylase family protein [Acidimicrobiales bacterium]
MSSTEPFPPADGAATAPDPARSGGGAPPALPPGPVLVVTAHPDDVDFGMGGSVAAWTSAGIEVAYCIVTNGDAGGFDPSISRADMAQLRQREQRAAAAELGVHDVRFLGYPDGRVTVTLELRRDISRVIRQVRPTCVATQSPVRDFSRIFAGHPDHLAVGEAALCAVYPDARNPFAHPELLDEGHAEHTVQEVWLSGSPTVDTWVDITETFERKLAALACHASQVSHHEQQAFRERLVTWAQAQAGRAGWPAGRLAEAFQRVPTG